MELVIRCFEDLMFEPDPNILLSSLALPSPSWKSFLWGFLLSRHLLTYICSGLATLCGLGSVAREGCPPELVSRARSLQLLKCAQGWHFAERAPPHGNDNDAGDGCPVTGVQGRNSFSPLSLSVPTFRWS